MRKTITLSRTVIAAGLSLAGVFSGGLSAAGPAVDSRLPEAAMHGDREAVRSLVKAHVDVNSPQQDGTTALLWAVRAGDRETVAVLLSHNAAVNAANRYGVTALSLAATNGDTPMIDDLLKAGADVNSASPEGETVLMTAARSGSAGAVKLLIDHGANVNLKESWQEETALMLAAAENHADVVRLLVAHGAEINAASKVLEPPKRKPVPGVALQATHTTYPRGGLTPLLFASRQGSLEAVQALIEARADLNLCDPDGISPMEMAILNANFDIAAMLLEKGADPNITDKSGRAPLYAAVDIHRFEWIFSRPTPRASGQLESWDIVKMLLAHGANPNARLTRRILPFQHDSTGNSNLTAGSTPFLKAASASDVQMMRLLIANGADPNVANDAKTTPLMLAAGLNWQDISNLGTEEESLEAIQICLDHGADVNATNKSGETALHGAAERGADSIVKFLVSKGAKLDAKTTTGRTPLDEAKGQDVILDESDVRRPVRPSTEALLRQLMSRNRL